MRNGASESEQRTLTAKKWQRLGQRHEGVLQNVFGIGVVAGTERMEDEAVDASGIRIIEFARGRGIAATQPFLQRNFVVAHLVVRRGQFALTMQHTRSRTIP